MKPKIPLILITGFLGSGKTSFLLHYLSLYSEKKKIAIVQNEFAQSSIDSEVLREKDSHFVLRELDRGSIFCTCLFSNFKDTLVDLSEKEEVDVVLIEATGIADPIGVAQVMEDQRISNAYYLEKIVTIVDACRFLNALEKIIGIRHQIEVADYILINKVDLVEDAVIQRIRERIESINPLSRIVTANYGKFNSQDLTSNDAIHTDSQKSVSVSFHLNGTAANSFGPMNQHFNVKGPVRFTLPKRRGQLTKCGEGNYISRIFKTAEPVSMDQLHTFLESLDEDVLRVKGYVMNQLGNSYMIQYVPGQIEIIPCQHAVGKTELISIGFKEPDFRLLQ